jgi:hypothetical protein
VFAFSSAIFTQEVLQVRASVQDRDIHFPSFGLGFLLASCCHFFCRFQGQDSAFFLGQRGRAGYADADGQRAK